MWKPECYCHIFICFGLCVFTSKSSVCLVRLELLVNHVTKIVCTLFLGELVKSEMSSSENSLWIGYTWAKPPLWEHRSERMRMGEARGGRAKVDPESTGAADDPTRIPVEEQDVENAPPVTPRGSQASHVQSGEKTSATGCGRELRLT